jgi:hypothetical protein
VIFGVAVTFLVTVGTTAAVTVLTPGFIPSVVLLVATPVLAVDDVVVDSTTGLVEGMGFPSLVCSFFCSENNVPNFDEYYLKK